MDEERVNFSEAKRRDVFKPISDFEYNQLGIEKGVRIVSTLDELREGFPKIVVAECVKDTGFIQNNFKKQYVYKKVRYVCSETIYHQLHFNPVTGERILRPANVKFKNLYKPYRGEKLQGKTILFWRTGGIGDLLFIKPILVHIKKTFSPCKIVFACGPQYQPMVETWQDDIIEDNERVVDHMIDLPFNINYLWKSNYHALFEGVIERCKEAHTTNCYRLFSKWLGLQIEDKDLVPKQIPKEEKIKYCKGVLKEWCLDEKSFVLVQVRASSPIRTPSPRFWKSVIDKLTSGGHKVVITDSVKQEDMIQKFIFILDNKDSVYNFSKYSTGIDDTIALCSLSKIALATDTALNHIAISLGIKALGIFGPFPGYVRLETYPKELCDWIDSKKSCAPCYIHGHKPCPNSDFGGHSKCYEELNLNEIIEKFENLLKR